jgi:hypothetical protein
MIFKDFSNLVKSFVSPVILLEGSRSVNEADKEKLTAIGGFAYKVADAYNL